METVSKEAKTLDLIDKDFKLAILNISKKKKPMSKELDGNEGICLTEYEISIKNRNYKKKPNRNSRIEIYHNSNEKFARRTQQFI